MSETIEQPDVEVEDAPVTEEPVARKTRAPKIRDHDQYLVDLRRENEKHRLENEKLRKTLEEQAAQRAEELANQRLENLRSEAEEKAIAKAEKLLEKRLSEMAEANKQRLVKSELKAHALRAGAIDFDDVYTILARDLGKVEFDDDGEVTNASDIIIDLKSRKPHLFAGVSTSSTERAPHTREQKIDKPALTMSDEEFERSLNRLIGAA